MIEPTPYSFLSPRERIRAIAAQDISRDDKAHLEPPSLTSRYALVHNAIKQYFLSLGNDLTAWQAVTNNPLTFNRVWCEMLGIKYEGKPPAQFWRFHVVNLNKLSK